MFKKNIKINTNEIVSKIRNEREYIIKVINSCTSIEQLSNAKNMLFTFIDKHKKDMYKYENIYIVCMYAEDEIIKAYKKKINNYVI